MQRAARRQAQARKAWQHRVTSKAYIAAIESLNTKGMTRGETGSVQQSGKRVEAKSGLSR